MARRLLVNDCLSALPDHTTFWHSLRDWFGCEFVGGDYAGLAEAADEAADGASLIIRNASYFGPIAASARVPTISLLQDIFDDGPMRKMQEAAIKSSAATVCNSAFTASKYENAKGYVGGSTEHPHIIPLPADFTTFAVANRMGLQQSLGLPDGCVIWVGAQTAVKGWDTFLRVVRMNPDIPFVAVFKDGEPDGMPPNLRTYERVSHAELAQLMGACRVLLCTSRTESQHLAGIEAGGCGLPIVAPQVGVYWQRHDLPGILVAESTPDAFGSAIRSALAIPSNPEDIHDYWRKEFNPDTVRGAWTALIEEVESK